jgi:hypothetical protein
MLQEGVKKVISLASNKRGREQVRQLPNVAKKTGNKDLTINVPVVYMVWCKVVLRGDYP